MYKIFSHNPQPSGKDTGKHRAKSIVADILKGLIPLAISVGLVVWLFHNIDIRKVEVIIRQGVEWRYIVIMMVITVLSHTIRGVRWGIQLRGAGIPRIPVMTECVSIYSAYALNLVFAYLGEAWRCIFIARRSKSKLSTVVGTDLGDRASDGVMILMLVVATLLLAHPALERFLGHYRVGEEISHILSDWVTWMWAGIILLVLVAVDFILRDTRIVKGINQSIKRIWQGFAVLFHMKGIGLYIMMTFGIWICYYLETYVCFYAFGFTRDALVTQANAWGFVPGLVVFVFGSCSMAVPSNGGLGPWNLAVIFALSLYGISENDAAAYSIVFWSFQAMTYVALGVFSAIYIAVTARKTRRSNISCPSGE